MDVAVVRSSLLRTCSAVAVSAVLLAGCASTEHSHSSSRYRSIKDDPVAPAPHARHVHKVAATSPAAGPRMTEPTPRRSMETPSRPPTKLIAEPPAKPEPARQDQPKSAALDPRPTPDVAATPALKPVEAQPIPSETPRPSAVVTEPAQPQPQRPAVVIKPAEPTPPPVDSRPTTDGRRKAADSAPTPPKTVTVTPPATVVPTPPPAAIVPPAVGLPAPVTNAAVPPKAPAATPPKVDASPEPKIAALSDDQRVAGVLSRADFYMKAGRYQEARTLLDDAGKTGNPKVLLALAETYDPLILREQYPKLSRTGDPEKAIAMYEQAKVKGADGLDARISALKTLAGPRR